MLRRLINVIKIPFSVNQQKNLAQTLSKVYVIKHLYKILFQGQKAQRVNELWSFLLSYYQTFDYRTLNHSPNNFLINFPH